MSNPVSKLELRLRAAVEEKRFYEAHQIYKTLYFRCLTRKKHTDAISHLYEGANLLLDNKQWESGTELACLLLDVFTKSKVELTEQHLDKICVLLGKLKPGDGRSNFVNKASSVLKASKHLLCLFNERVARLLWNEGAFGQARYHVMLSSNGYAVGTFLIALHQHAGLRSEIDLFLTQAVLQFLCMRQVTVATVTYYTYTRKHPQLEPGPPFIHFPLLNFLWFLMLAIEKKCAVSVFSVLCEKYEPQLRRDSSFLTYLDKIGQLYFNIEPPHKESNNLFSSILKLFESADSVTSDGDEPTPSTSRTAVDTMHVEDVD